MPTDWLPGAVGWESRALPPPDRPDAYSRSALERRRQPFLAAIVPPIATARFTLDPTVLTEADEASTAIAHFDASSEAFPAPFAAVLLRSESASSSQIERLTVGARALAEAEIGEQASGNGPLVVRNVRAMEAAIRLADDLDHHAIIRMHEILLGPDRPELVGRYRVEQVWLGGRLPHDAEFVPPHHDRVPAAMDDFVRFTRRTDLPVLAHAAIAHAQFETIHPFPDGNGRAGRSILQAMLRRGGLLRHTTIPVSSGLLGDLDRYFDALRAHQLGDPNPIIAVVGSSALRGLANARVLAEDIGALQSTWATALRGLRADAAARRLATATIAQPVISSKVAAELLATSTQTALTALDALAERGILTLDRSRRRNRIWVNEPVLRALDEFADRSLRRAS